MILKITQLDFVNLETYEKQALIEIQSSVLHSLQPQALYLKCTTQSFT